MISIIIPVFNVKEYLSECMESICNQDYSDLEILVIDDGSTDGSELICDQFAAQDSRIKVVHQNNQGLSAARNKGLSMAHGEFITFVDSDDYVAYNYISYLKQVMEQEDGDMAICRFYNVRTIGKNFRRENPCVSKAEQYVMRGEDILPRRFGKLKVYYILSTNKMYKKEIFQGISFKEGCNCEDGFISLDLYRTCKKIICTDELLYYYRNRPGSLSHDTSLKWVESQMSWLEHEISYFVESGNPSNIVFPAKPYVSFIYKNRRRLLEPLHNKPFWEIAIHSLLSSDVITFPEKLKYLYYRTRYKK